MSTQLTNKFARINVAQLRLIAADEPKRAQDFVHIVMRDEQCALWITHDIAELFGMSASMFSVHTKYRDVPMLLLTRSVVAAMRMRATGTLQSAALVALADRFFRIAGFAQG